MEPIRLWLMESASAWMVILNLVVIVGLSLTALKIKYGKILGVFVLQAMNV